ncbi:MAG: 50S ribosomal protein L11 methyltransferase [Massiliimalia sp.]
MDWSQVKLYTTTQGISVVSGYVVSHGIRGVMIEDANDFNDFLEDTSVHWDYIDDDLMKMKECPTAVVFYVPDNMQGMEMLKAIRGGIDKLREENSQVELGSLTFESENIREEDWETAWKKYYHPVRVGKHIVVCPCWENCELGEQDVKVTLDPGMAFGTGTHETTRLCMAFLEKYITPDTTMLDVGTGSGILAITALLLGTRQAVGVDIDELAVKIAQENADLNGVGDRIELYCGDLTEKIHGTYDVICANIVADVIIRLCDTVTGFMHKDTVLIVSGIIEDRCQDVFGALDRAGLTIVEKNQENDWVSVVVKLKE